MLEKLRIIVFPNSDDDECKDIVMSTVDKVYVNKTGDLYHIDYKLKDYLQLNLDAFAKTVSEMFKKNVPGSVFELDVIGRIDPDDIPLGMNSTINPTQILKIHILQNAFKLNSTNIIMKRHKPIALGDTNITPFTFESANTESYIEDDEDDYEDEDDDYEDDLSRDDQYFMEDELYEDADEDETLDTINKILGMSGDIGNTYDSSGLFNSDKMIYEKTKKRKSYPSSKILKSAKHAKKDIKNHGIIIQSGKSRDKDEEIIRSFLKDFIPGKSNWIKSYRKIILKRWMNQYAITKKAAKKYEKQSQLVKKTNRKGTVSIDTASKVTRNILKHYNPFYDTSK
jgi:hypothetical protein